MLSHHDDVVAVAFCFGAMFGYMSGFVTRRNLQTGMVWALTATTEALHFATSFKDNYLVGVVVPLCCLYLRCSEEVHE